MEFKLLNKDRVYNGFFKLDCYTLQHELFSGGQSEPFKREILNRGDAVAVLIRDPDENTFLIVKQFRVGAIESGEPWVYELVAGMIDKGETVENVAKREAEEEAGVEISNLRKINTHFNSVGGCSETTTLFYAEADLSNAGGIHGLASENEDILAEVISAKAFAEGLETGSFNTASLVMAAFWAKAEGFI